MPDGRTLKKNVRKTTAGSIKSKRIHSVCVEPDGGCAMTSITERAVGTYAAIGAWRLRGDDAQTVTMILPSSHSKSVKSVARNEGGLQKSCEGWNSREADCRQLVRMT